MWRVLPRWKYLSFAWVRSAAALTLIAAIATGFDPALVIGLGIVVFSRVVSACVLNALFIKSRNVGRFLWVLPAVEIANCVSSIGAVFVPRVSWRGDHYRVREGGTAVRMAEPGGKP